MSSLPSQLQAFIWETHRSDEPKLNSRLTISAVFSQASLSIVATARYSEFPNMGEDVSVTATVPIVWGDGSFTMPTAINVSASNSAGNPVTFSAPANVAQGYSVDWGLRNASFFSARYQAVAQPFFNGGQQSNPPPA